MTTDARTPLERTPRVLLLLPTRGYRSKAFVDAAERLGAALTIASEEPSSLEGLNPGGLLALDFGRPREAARAAAVFHRSYPLTAVVGVDDATTLLQAEISEAIGLRSNPTSAVATARDKFRTRRVLQDAGIAGPAFQLFTIAEGPDYAAGNVRYPCVLKPLVLSGSRGVIRADDEAEFIAAFRRIAAILGEPDIAAMGDAAQKILVEDFIPGDEIALEGILIEGRLHVLAVFDKPDPLNGPYFEETLYITPSAQSESSQRAAAEEVGRAAAALGLSEGPIHAELRVENGAPVTVEVNPRSIGGRCSRMLQFGAGMSLEELILRRALGMEIPSLQRRGEAVGAMMIPVPASGTLVDWDGEVSALAVPGITGLEMTAHRGQELLPLPEGSAYLGFIFAAGPTPRDVETSLRSAHRELRFTVEKSQRAAGQPRRAGPPGG